MKRINLKFRMILCYLLEVIYFKHSRVWSSKYLIFQSVSKAHLFLACLSLAPHLQDAGHTPCTQVSPGQELHCLLVLNPVDHIPMCYFYARTRAAASDRTGISPPTREFLTSFSLPKTQQLIKKHHPQYCLFFSDLNIFPKVATHLEINKIFFIQHSYYNSYSYMLKTQKLESEIGKAKSKMNNSRAICVGQL